jgi:hypothetical protein
MDAKGGLEYRYSILRLRNESRGNRANFKMGAERLNLIGSSSCPAPQRLNIYQLDIMNSLRIARTALRVRPTAVRAPLQRRGYAEAVSDKVGILGQILRPQLTSSRSS